jgi:ABC-2 type transport system ATP-binding protein
MINLSEVTKRYGDLVAVDNVSLAIEQGSVFGLLGPNGAGKTTIIKLMTALSKPDRGQVLIGECDVLRNPLGVKKLMGVVPQENNLDRELTAYENLLIYAMLHKVKNREQRIKYCLELVDLWDRRDGLTSKFSGGMQRRLLIARALLTDPAVLFLDEPSVGLDPQIRRQVADIIRKTRMQGRTVVITTHYIEEAESLCDQVGILSKGSLIALGTPNELKAMVGEYIVESVDHEGRLLQHICKTRDEANQVARNIDYQVIIRKSNLEDVFIWLTGERIE